MRTLHLILILTLTLCLGGALSAEETTQTETAKNSPPPQTETASKPEAENEKDAPPVEQPQSPPAPTVQPAGQPGASKNGEKTQLLWVQDSGVYTPRDAKITRVENKPIPEIKDIPESIKQNLFPGESCTFAGVTIQWDVNENEIPKSAGEWAPLGRLQVRGPVNRIEDIDTGMHANWERRVVDMLRNSTKPGKTPPGPYNTHAYVDNVSFFVENVGDKLGTNAHLAMNISYSPSHRKYSPSTRNAEMVDLSSACPVTLNEWELRLSDKTVRSPDGSEQLQISIQNGKTGEKFELPAIGGAMRRFGRFESKVHEVYLPTRTVTMEIAVSRDETVRGREAVVSSQKFREFLQGEAISVGKLLDSLSKEYGFEIEWSGFEGFGPEAGEYAKSLSVDVNFMSSHEMTSVDFAVQILKRSLPKKIEPVWTDDTHLRIRPIGYEEVKKEEERKARTQATEEEAIKGLAAQREEATKRFETEYALETRIYHLKAISPDAAAQLIRKQLNTYYLLEKPYDMTKSEDGSIRFVSEEGLAQLHFVDKKKERQEPEKVDPSNVYIPRDPGGKRRQAKQLASIEEATVADSRTNSLLVTALPKTQNLVGETIGRMEETFEQELKAVAQEPVPRRRLEVVLLQGTTNGTSETTNSEFSEYAKQNGEISQILVKPGQAVKRGDLIAQLDKEELEVAYTQLQATIKENQAKLEEARNQTKAANEQEAGSGSSDKKMEDLVEKREKLRNAALAHKAEMTDEPMKNNLRAIESQLKDCELRASEDGVVSKILVELHQKVKSDQPILKIATRIGGTNPSNLESARFSQEGVLEQVLVKKGQTVKAGDPLAQMNSQELRAQCERAEAALKEKQAILDEKTNLLKIAEQKFATGTMVESDLVSARADLEKARAQLAQNELDLKMAVTRLGNCELKATGEGVVTDILVQPNEPVRVGQPVLRIAPKPEAESPDAPKKTQTDKKALSDPVAATAKEYGINPDDLKFFHFTELQERGRTILTLGETTGKEGKAAADLGGGPYRCEFEYQAWRAPYLVVNALLKGPANGEAGTEAKGLIENTLYLQEGVPSVLGITNLREGLILVVRLAVSPAQKTEPSAQPEPTGQPKPSDPEKPVPQAETE
jgi:multidrug efflux pump subunit AcrA (membrane-fusion protein)